MKRKHRKCGTEIEVADGAISPYCPECGDSFKLEDFEPAKKAPAKKKKTLKKKKKD